MNGIIFFYPLMETGQAVGGPQERIWGSSWGAAVQWLAVQGPLAAGVLPILMVHDLMGAARSLPCRRVTVRGPVQFTWILGGISQGAGPVKH